MMKTRLIALLTLLLPAVASGQSYDGQGRLRVNDNLTQIVGAAPSATNALPAQLSNGTSFIVPVLDTTLTARFPVGSTPADNESNAVTITRSGAFMFVFDGSTWDRWTGAVSQSGTWNVGTVTTVTTLTSITNPVAVTGTFWQATQPVSGNVSAFITDGIDTASVTAGNELQVTSSQSGPWNLRLTDIGGDTATILNLTNEDPLAVAIVDGAGSQITSFGGGVQYTEADTDASVTGTAVMWEDAADTLRVASATKPLPVNVVAGGAGDGAIQDGTTPSIEATVLDFTNSNPLAVRLTDTNGDYVGAGAGTQYVDGAAQATPTGTVALGHDGSNVRAITTDSAGDLQVDLKEYPAGQKTMSLSLPVVVASDNIVPTRLSQVSTDNDVNLTDGVETALISAAGALTVDGSGVTQPVSGSVTSAPALSAAALPVRPVNSSRTASGTLGALNDAVAIAGEGASAVTFEIDAGLTGTATFEATLDGTNWFVARAHDIVFPGGWDTSVSTGSLPFRGSFANTGFAQYRIRVSAYTSGSSAARMSASAAVGSVIIGGGTLDFINNNLGVIGQKSNNTAVPGTQLIGTISAVANAAAPTYTEGNMVLPRTQLDGDLVVEMEDALPAGNANIGDVDVASMPAITGTVTANAGTNLNTSALVLESTVGRAQGSTTSGQTGPLIQGAVTTSPPVYTTAQTSPFSLTTSGYLRSFVDIQQYLGSSVGPSNAIHVDPIDRDARILGRTKIHDGTDTALVSGTGSLQVTCDNCGGSTFADDDAFTGGTTAVVPFAALYDTSPPAITDGSAGAPRMTSTRALMVDGSAVTQPVSGTFWQATQPVSGTFWQATQPVSIAAAVTVAQATAANLNATVTDGSGPLTVDGTVTANQGGAPWSMAISQTTTNNDVDVTTLPNVTIGTFPDNEPFNLAQIAGASTAVSNGTAATALRVTVASDSTGQLAVAGTAAHDGTTLPNPIGTGAFAETAEDSDANTNANRVSADADLVRLAADRNGTLYVRNGPPHRWAYHENSSSTLTDTTVHASCGTGLYNYVESITASTGGATAFSILIEDSTTTTILGPYYLEAVAGRGLSVVYPGGRKQSTAATLISVTTTGAVAHGIDITGFCAP